MNPKPIKWLFHTRRIWEQDCRARWPFSNQPSHFLNAFFTCTLEEMSYEIYIHSWDICMILSKLCRHLSPSGNLYSSKLFIASAPVWLRQVMLLSSIILVRFNTVIDDLNYFHPFALLGTYFHQESQCSVFFHAKDLFSAFTLLSLWLILLIC